MSVLEISSKSENNHDEYVYNTKHSKVMQNNVTLFKILVLQFEIAMLLTFLFDAHIVKLPPKCANTIHQFSFTADNRIFINWSVDVIYLLTNVST